MSIFLFFLSFGVILQSPARNSQFKVDCLLKQVLNIAQKQVISYTLVSRNCFFFPLWCFQIFSNYLENYNWWCQNFMAYAYEVK